MSSLCLRLGLVVALLCPGCGSESPAPAPASQPEEKALTELEPHDFRRLLSELRAEEFEEFEKFTDYLVRFVLRELPNNMADVDIIAPNLKSVASLVPLDPHPSVYIGTVPPANRFQERVERLGRAVVGTRATKDGIVGEVQLSDAAVDALRGDVAEFVIKVALPTLSKAVEKVPTAVKRLDAYAPPPAWHLSGRPPKTLYGWLYRMQRRALSKSDPWDVRMGDLVAKSPDRWEDGTHPVDICLARMMREMLHAPHMVWAMIVVMRYGPPERFEGAFRKMLEETWDGIVADVSARVQRTWNRAVVSIDKYLFQEFIREPADASAVPAQKPVADADETPATRGGDVDEGLSTDGGRQGKDYALLVAVDDYAHWRDLHNPVRDATTIASVLSETYGFEEPDVLVNPTKKAFTEKILEHVRREFRPHDQLLIFFAGHGHYDERPLDMGYLVFKDSRAQKDDPTRETYMRHAALLALVKRIPCRHVLLMLDACFGGAAFEEQLEPVFRGSGDVMADVSVGEMIRRKMPIPTRKLITSGGKEYVWDGPRKGHSPFASRFLEALRSLEGRKEGVLTYADVFGHLQTARPPPFGGKMAGDRPGSEFLFIKR